MTESSQTRSSERPLPSEWLWAPLSCEDVLTVAKSGAIPAERVSVEGIQYFGDRPVRRFAAAPLVTILKAFAQAMNAGTPIRGVLMSLTPRGRSGSGIATAFRNIDARYELVDDRGCRMFHPVSTITEGQSYRALGARDRFLPLIMEDHREMRWKELELGEGFSLEPSNKRGFVSRCLMIVPDADERSAIVEAGHAALLEDSVSEQNHSQYIARLVVVEAAKVTSKQIDGIDSSKSFLAEYAIGKPASYPVKPLPEVPAELLEGAKAALSQAMEAGKAEGERPLEPYLYNGFNVGSIVASGKGNSLGIRVAKTAGHIVTSGKRYDVNFDWRQFAPIDDSSQIGINAPRLGQQIRVARAVCDALNTFYKPLDVTFGFSHLDLWR